MGLPIKQLIIASNENDILPRTVETGAYEMKGVVATSSPSMDIQISSNFERYLFEASGRDAALIRGFMKDLGDKKRFNLGPVWQVLKAEFAARAASEKDVADCIRTTKQQHGYVLDPHSACGVVAADRAGGDGDVVVLATAHPAKFPDAIEAITGARPGLPKRLANLMSDPERFEVLANDLAAVERFVEHAAASRAKATS
jgi:threonine synthase